jgi:hypothetical protein
MEPISKDANSQVTKTVHHPLQMMEQLQSFAYVNGSEMASNNWDVHIALGERLPNGKSEARVGIVMSHQHFKAFVTTMHIQLKRLEQMMGEIRYTPINLDDTDASDDSGTE